MTSTPSSPSAPAAAGAPQRGHLGTFLGVFTPTILTILGVIMYLRLGWVVGQVGLGQALGIVVLANVITLITTLSFSAVATNIRVGVGGAYYVISRSFGLELGGAIGLPLFLSQVFSVTLYAFGLAEALRIVWPALPEQEAAFVIVVAVGALALRGAGVALKSQIPLMILIGVSLVALLVGTAIGPAVTIEDVAVPPVTEAPPGFWAVFAVFFPAVTGVMAGLGLSGDLRDPSRSIPRGAIAATVTGFGVYLVLPVVLWFAASPEALRADKTIWTHIAPLGAWLILPGLCGAIFSSAVGSILGAPRTIQAMAMDGMAPQWLARVSPRLGEPVFALIVTTVMALAAVLLGDLNAVAPVVSMFFLTVYGMVNLVAALEELSSDPSWRPRVRLPWWLSLIGAFGCMGAMFLISPAASIVAIAVELLLYAAFKRHERQVTWGDARRGAYEALIRWSLVKLAGRPMTARSWRPHVLVFVGDVDRRLSLIRFGTWFSQERGVVTVCEMQIGDVMDDAVQPLARREAVDESLRKQGLMAFGETAVVEDVVSGIVSVSQANGMAGLQSNVIVIAYPDDREGLADLLRGTRSLERLHKSVVIGRVQEGWLPPRGRSREIHIWWGGLHHNGDLMLLLAHLLTRNAEWRQGRIRIMSVAASEDAKRQTEEYLAELLPQIRIACEARVTVREEGRHISEVIHAESGRADVTFLGLGVPEKGAEGAYAERLQQLARGLRTVFFVKNSSLFVGDLIGETWTSGDELPGQPHA